MMERSKQCLKILKVVTMLITLFIFAFCSSFSAYALNENYMIDEYHNWLDVEDRYDYNQNNDGFDGFLKHVSDENDCSFYIFFKFFDTRIVNGNDENIVLTFTVENSENKYCFSVNKDGFINTGQNDINDVRLVSNFDNFSCSSMGGEIFIGFELKNSVDRALTNYISCDYAAGVDTTTVLFENEVLDLFVEPTEKATTKEKSVKNTVTKEKTTQKKSSTSAKSNTAKSNKSKNTGTTKFKGSGIYAEDSSEYSNHDNADTEDEETVVQRPDTAAEMSTAAIIILIISIIAIIAGIIVLTVALVSKNKKTENEENIEESSL